MQVLKPTIRTILAALALTGLVASAGVPPTLTTLAGSSGQPGDIDVGSTPIAPTAWLAGSSGQPGDIDVG